MNQSIAEEYNEMASNFRFQSGQPQEEFLGRMNLSMDEQILKGGIISDTLFFTITDRQVMVVNCIGTTYNFDYHDLRNQRLEILDGCVADEGEVILLLRTENQENMIMVLSIRGKIMPTFQAKVDKELGSFCKIYYFQGNIIILEENLDQLYKFQRNTYGQKPPIQGFITSAKEKSSPPMDKKFQFKRNKKEFTKIIKENQQLKFVKFSGFYFLHLSGNVLKLMDMRGSMKAKSIVPFKTTSVLVEILEVSPARLMLVTKTLKVFLVDLNTKQVKVRNGPSGMKLKNNFKVVGGLNQKILFINSRDNNLYYYNYKVSDQEPELIGTSDESLRLLDCNTSKRFYISFSDIHKQLELNSFALDLDRENNAQLELEFGLRPENILYMEEQGVVIFSGNCKKLQTYNLQTKEHKIHCPIETMARGIIYSGIENKIVVFTDFSAKNYVLKEDGIEETETIFFVNDKFNKERVPLEIISSVEIGRFAIYHDNMIIVFEKGHKIYRCSTHFNQAIIYSLHPIDLSIVYWENNSLRYWELDLEPRSEQIKEATQPQSVVLLPELFILVNKNSIVFLNALDRRTLNIFTIPSREDMIKGQIRVIPLLEQHSLAVYLTNELYLIDRGTLKVKEWWRLSPFEQIRNIFQGVHNPKEFSLVTQNIFGYEAHLTKYTNVLKTKFMIKPKGKVCDAVVQNGEIDAIYVEKKNTIKFLETNSWTEKKKFRDVKPIKQMEFANYAELNGNRPLLLLLKSNRFQKIIGERYNTNKEFYNLRLESRQTEIICFCSGKEGIYMCTASAIIKATLLSLEKPGFNLKTIKQETLPLSNSNPIKEIKYYANGQNGLGVLLVVTKEGWFFEVTETLNYTKTYQAMNYSSFMEADYLVSNTGRFGVKIDRKDAEVFELSTGKVIYKNQKYLIEENRVLCQLKDAMKGQLAFTFDKNDEIMAFTGSPDKKVWIISIKNAEEFNYSEDNVIEKLSPESSYFTFFKLVQPGYTLILGDGNSIKRITFGNDKKISKTLIASVQKIFFPKHSEPEEGTKKLFSWYFSYKGEISYYDHSKNVLINVDSIPIHGMIARMTATTNNSHVGYITLSGQMQVLETKTCKSLFQKYPQTVNEDIRISTTSSTQDVIYFIYRTGGLWALNLRSASLDCVLDETVNEMKYMTFLGMTCGEEDKFLYLASKQGNIFKVNIEAKEIEEIPNFSIQISQIPKYNLNPIEYIKSDNSLVLASQKRVVFFDLDYNRFQRSYQAQDKSVFSEVWVSDDDRYVVVSATEPHPKIFVLRFSNLGKVWEYDLPSSLIFREVVFNDCSKTMRIIFKDQFFKVNFNTFDDTYSDLVISGRSNSFTYEKAFGYNLHMDLCTLSAKCLNQEEGQELSVMRIFEEILREKVQANQLGKPGMLDLFVEGPNWGGKDLMIWNSFLLKSNNKEIQELLNISIYQRVITNPYAQDPMSHMIAKLDQNEMIKFFGAEFFEVYFSYFTLKMKKKKKDLIIIDSKRLNESIEKSPVWAIEEGYESEIVGNIEDPQVTKSFGYINRTTLDVFDREFDNPKFIHLLMLLNEMPISVFKNESIAQITDYYWKRYKIPGQIYFFFYLFFMFFICLHVYYGGDTGMQLIDYFLLIYLVIFISLYTFWEAINLRFQGWSYFSNRQYILTLIVLALTLVYLVMLQYGGEVYSNFSSIVIFVAFIKLIFASQYIDSIRQFSTRMINIVIDIKIFLFLMLLFSISFGMLFFVLDIGDKSFLKLEEEIMTAFNFYFSNWDLDTGFLTRLFYQLLLMIAYGVIAFNILIALANNSWEDSGKQGEAFDRKKVMGLIISNWNVIKGILTFVKKRKPIERIYLYMYTKPQRGLPLDKTQKSIAILKKALLRIMKIHEELGKDFLETKEKQEEKKDK